MKTNEKVIISIDGGGIRGIVSSYILNIVEKELGNPLVDYIDLAAGTSTGAIIAAGIASRIPMERMLDLYLTEGPNIFSRDLKQRIKSVNGLRGGKFDLENFQSILRKYFSDSTLNDLECDFLATSYNMSTAKPEFFNRRIEGGKSVVDVVSASAAAPTYFSPVEIDMDFFIDGGVVTSNPSMVAFAELKNYYNLPADEIFILSVGNGARLKHYDDPSKWFKLKWINPLIDIQMSADGGVVHFQLSRIYKSIDKSDLYYRINDYLPSDISTDMGNASKKNINNLLKFAETVANKSEQKIENIIKKLKKQ